MARLSDSITYGSHAITGELIVAGTQIVPVNLTGGTNVNVAGSYPNFTISATDTDTNTTYSAGTGITLAGTTFSLTGDSFSSTGTYAGLRAQATTKADVGLSLIPNATVTSAGTANAIMRRDGNGDVFCRLFRSTYAVTNPTIAGIYTTQTVGGDFMRPSTPAQVKTALSIAAGDVSGLSDAATTTVATIRSGTTAANVGLGNVRNVSSYSQSEANANFLGSAAKAADSNLLDGIDSTSFMRTTGTNNISADIISTGTTIEVGSGSGSVAMTINDSQGNANLTFNHSDGTADIAGNVARIEVPVDSTTGAYIGFHVANNAATGTVSPAEVFRMEPTSSICYGELRATGDVVAFFSDERLKDFHGPIDNAVEKILALTGYYYTANDVAKSLGYDNEDMQLGVSAQEVQAIFPEAVTKAPISQKEEVDVDYLTVKYEKLVPALIEAIKEQQKQIDELKRKVG